jgi:hypothetical protein
MAAVFPILPQITPNDVAALSSRGPTADGRFKPDIQAPGTHISGGVWQARNPGPLGHRRNWVSKATASAAE